jgi:hypothetical protein
MDLVPLGDFFDRFTRRFSTFSTFSTFLSYFLDFLEARRHLVRPWTPKTWCHLLVGGGPQTPSTRCQLLEVADAMLSDGTPLHKAICTAGSKPQASHPRCLAVHPVHSREGARFT